MTPSPHPLTPYLVELARCSAEIDDILATQADLQHHIPDVDAYVTLGKEATAARKAKKKAYAALAQAALDLYDGTEAELHDDVQIALFKDARIHNHAAALLWLLCNAADTVNVLDTGNMTKAVKNVATNTSLVLRRSQAIAAVEELFTKPSILVDGWIVVTSATGKSTPRWFRATYDDLDNLAAARLRAENEVQQIVTADETWQWREPPTVEQTSLAVDHILFAEPTTNPKPRISQDLSHLLSKDEGQPLVARSMKYETEEASSFIRHTSSLIPPKEV